MKDELQINLQRQFAVAALRAGVRIDGRALDASRQIKITLGPAHGQAHVSLGSTVALASTIVEAVTPYSDRPSEGTLAISVELSPAASEAAALEFAVHGSHPPADRVAMALRGSVERVIRDSRAVDTEALCILAGKKVWAVSVDVSIVDAAGNCADAVHLAAMAALLHARRNDVSISGTDIHIHPFSEREPLPLPVHHIPLTITYALFAGTNDFLDDIAAMDPCLEEELACDGVVTVALNAHGEVCGLHKAGGLPVDPKLVSRCASVAADRVVALTELLNKSLHESSVKHHPLAAVRPVLIAPEPTAIVPERREGATSGKKPSRAADAADCDVEMPLATFEGCASTWNAVPVSESLPPPVLVEKPTLSTTTKNGNGQSGLPAGDFAASAFRALEQRADPSAPLPDRNSKGGLQKTSAAPPAVAEDSMDSENSDSDEDLLAAVIAKPKGGGARRAKPKVKR
jgi:exosome complex component RRP45